MRCGTAALLLFGCGSEAEPHRPASALAPAPSLSVAGPQASVSAASASTSALPGAASASTSAPVFPSDREPPRAFDLHVDTPWQVKFKGRSVELPEGQATMDGLRKGNYGAIVYPIYIADHLHKGHPTIRDAEEIFDTVDAILSHHKDVLWPATTSDRPPPGKVLAYVSIEGAGVFASDITQIDRFIARGVVLVGPVHAKDNKLATSATGADKKSGLSDLGKKFCERVYDDGALVDVSHMSDRAFSDLADIAEARGLPIVATHSNARAITNHPRNLPDSALARIAKSGGIAGLNFHHSFLNGGATASLSDAVKHAQYMIAKMGIDHVAIGSDFDGGNPPADLADASFLPELAKALREAGLSASDVHKIFSENARRVLRFTDKRKTAPTPE